jgi:hypothetical protein
LEFLKNALITTPTSQQDLLLSSSSLIIMNRLLPEIERATRLTLTDGSSAVRTTGKSLFLDILNIYWPSSSEKICNSILIEDAASGKRLVMMMMMILFFFRKIY